MHRVRMLIHFGVTPYLVFDGDYLPSKAATEDERAKKRAESKRLGQELERVGKISQAYLEFQKAIDVTPEMARQLIEELKRHNVKYVVAPYEADSQLAYLERKGIIHGVLSEDSDLLVFGVKRLLTKLDQYGDCVEINRKDFAACKDINLVGWTDVEFRTMAILSGCDYLPNINKMGLKTAYRQVRKHKSIEKILRMLSFDGAFRIPPGYLEDFRKAELTFLHQRVYCPTRRQIVHLTPLNGPEPDDFDFIGRHVDDTIAIGVATGDLNPMTKEQIIYYPALRPAHSPSPWSLNRRNTLNTPSELKPKKPIDEFFKPKRVPLAELDPNSFTPSPSQQRVLEQQSGSVDSTPITTIGSSFRSAVTGARQGRSISTVARPSSASRTQHPPKRQRLCADDDSEGSAEASPTSTQSRFFSSSVLDPSPSLHAKSRRRVKGTAVNLWSDDSVEDAMLKLPDVSERTSRDPSKPKILRSPSDGSQSVSTNETGDTESTAPTVATLSTNPTDLSTLETPPSSGASVSVDDAKSRQPYSSTPTLPKKLTSSFQAIAKRYSLAASTEKQATAQTQTCTKTTNSVRTPVQRTASRLPRSSTNPYSTFTQSVSDTQITYPQLPSASKNSSYSPVPKKLHPSLEVAQSPERLAKKTLVQGSEDCLVPCSEAESEGEDNSVGDIDVSKQFSLKHFAFVS